MLLTTDEFLRDLSENYFMKGRSLCSFYEMSLFISGGKTNQ